jgi:hypothetical protein
MLSRLPRLLALAGLLAVLPGAAAAQTADDSLDIAILDVLKARGIIDDAEYAELRQLAIQQRDAHASEVSLVEASLKRLAAPEVRVSGGQPGKLQFRSEDGKWSMTLKGRLQSRGETIDSDDDAQDGTNFSVARGRLGFEGTAGAENVTYKFEFDAATQNNFSSTSSTKNFILRDAYINWAFGPLSAARFGQFKVPLGREELISGFSQSHIDRSITSVEFTPQFEPGAMLHGAPAEGSWEYYVALQNGQGPSQNNTAGDDQNGLRKTVRLVWNPLGAVKLDGPAFQTVDDGSTKLALGVAYSRNDDSTGKTAVTPGADTGTLGLEGQLFSGPWSVLADVFERESDIPGGGDNVHDTGHTFQLGWFAVPNRWELVARTAAINFDDADDRNEHVLGVNYYVDKHNGKWQLDFSKLQNDGETADANRVRVQYQLQF